MTDRIQGDSKDEILSWNEALVHSVATNLCGSYGTGQGVSYIEKGVIPEREVIISLLEKMSDILFPGYSGRLNISAAGQYFSIGSLLNEVYAELSVQIAKAFAFNHRLNQESGSCEDCVQLASQHAAALLAKFPAIREMLLDDAQAALDGDPAAKSMDEVILAYPGFKCILVHRIAHELYQAQVPLIPRVMSEHAHTVTGIDINPGACIGRHFFIDHGTGVVIGETAVIGDNAKLYQGVTLGALSFPKDSAGKVIKGNKRHPNLEDNVTIYAESTILGNVTIGHNSVIGGNVWLTEDVPPFSKVTIEPTKVSIEQKHKH